MSEPTAVPHFDPGTAPATRLADGEWHRLHPATPLLRGGIAFLAIIGFVIANLRETLVNLLVGGPGRANGYDGDPFAVLIQHQLLPLAIGVLALGLILFTLGFYVAWRMRTFRITDQVVEVRSGILFRTNRKGRLDRIQGINIVRPLLARLVGAARLEIDVAGQDGNVQLDYLSSSMADDLRRDILLLASGTRAREAAVPGAGANTAAQATSRVGDFVSARASDLLAPELEPGLAHPDSVVRMHVGRLLGSTILHDRTVTFLAVLIGAGVAFATTRQPYALFGLVPFFLGLGSVIVRRFTKSLRYSIAGTPDGVRIGYGLLSTSNETLPPGRIHSVEVFQPILWRFAGWWEVRVNRATRQGRQGANGQQNTTILPVGNQDEVMAVLALLLPDLTDERSLALLRHGITRDRGDEYVTSPPRAAVIRWFSWRRNGFASAPGAVLFRKGAIWRTLVIAPEARVQSVAIYQGPLLRVLRLATLTLHTVAGPITARLGAVDRDAALQFFGTVAAGVVASSRSDRSHRWRQGEAPA